MKTDKPNLKQALSRFPLKLVLALAVSTLLFLGVFLVVWELGYEIVVSIVYGVITLAVALWYIAANKGFVGKLPSIEDLPVTWDKKQKESFLADLRERRKKSKKLMLILLPMLASFCYKLLDLYVFPAFSFADFFSKLFS